MSTRAARSVQGGKEGQGARAFSYHALLALLGVETITCYHALLALRRASDITCYHALRVLLFHPARRKIAREPLIRTTPSCSQKYRNSPITLKVNTLLQLCCLLHEQADAITSFMHKGGENRSAAFHAAFVRGKDKDVYMYRCVCCGIL
jgi:hypothetical protein